MQSLNSMKICGIVEDIIYKNNVNGYTVLNIDSDGVLVTCVGKSADINEGEFVEMEGTYVTNKTYGEQFAYESIKISEPLTTDGIERYLSSGLIKGVGEVTARRIVNKFGKDTLKVIEFTPERLAEVTGISLNKAQNIGSEFSEVKLMQRSVMFLQERGLTTNMSVKIFNIYGNDTIDTISANPYKLIEDIDGVGFLTADKIAHKLGVAKNSEFRLRAAILHILKEAADKNGNTYLPLNELISSVHALTQMEVAVFEPLFLKVIDLLNLDKHIRLLDIFGKAVDTPDLITVIKNEEDKTKIAVMLSKFLFYEDFVAKKLATFNALTSKTNIDISADVSFYEQQNNVLLHEKQKEAISLAISSQVCVITGGPGTGKTTILKGILSLLKNDTSKIYLVAPTGRAAKRLSEACGMEASTIHRALEVRKQEGDGDFFVYNEKHKLPADVVIIDEVSMIDVSLMYYLVRALPTTCKLILVGDKDQLPSVGAGNVLHDILDSCVIPSVGLSQIYRQDENSLIVTNAHLINSGKMPEFNNQSKDFFFEERSDSNDMLKTVIELVTDRLPKYTGLPPAQIQVLAAMKNGLCGVNNLNKKLQEVINPQSLSKVDITFENIIFRTGDKVMQMTNNYNKEWERTSDGLTENGKGVFNGDIGKIVHIDFQTHETTVEFEDGRTAVYTKADIFELSICYATTIHKSQGSEFDVVVIPILTGSPTIVTKNLLYTAVTRAKKIVVLVGSKKNIAFMLHNSYTAKRYSMLSVFLQHKNKKYKKLYE